MKKIILALAAMLVVSGCAMLTEGDSQARLVTMYATLKVVDGDAGKATRVEEIATEVQEYASQETFLTVDLLIAAIRDRVPWHDLDAADELLVNALLDELRNELIRRLGSDVLPEDLRLAVENVTGWVISASRMT